MSLAFWNNPIVVSAFRVKYRRGGMNAIAFYVLLLVVGGAVLHYYQDSIGGFWPRNYFMGLVGLQFVVSGLMAVTATATAMKAEVAQRTLDFQRIAALSPRQILLGKLLGEPAQAYLLAIATIPMAVFCWLLGGVSFDGLVFMYVQLFTTTLMFGSMGLLVRIDGEGRKSAGRQSLGQGLVFGFVIILVMTIPALLASGMAVMNFPWAGALIGLATPLPTYYGIFKGNPWLFHLAWFGVDIPFLWLTPLSQLLIALLCFQSMVRQLVNPLHPPLSKGLAYVLLALVDGLTAGVLWDSAPLLTSLEVRSAIFCLVHLLVSLALTAGITAWRETLHSWVWRFRGQGRRGRDRWLGNRSENSLALLTFCALGVVSLLLGVVLPVVREEGTAAIQESGLVVAAALLLTVVLILTLGTLYQWYVFLAGRGGAGVILSVMLLVDLIPHLVGYRFALVWLLKLCPSYYFGGWLAGQPQNGNPLLDMIPLLLLYGTALVVVWSLFRRFLRTLERIVDRKLAVMGVPPAERSGRPGAVHG